MEEVIKTYGLTKRFGSFTAVCFEQPRWFTESSGCVWYTAANFILARYTSRLLRCCIGQWLFFNIDSWHFRRYLGCGRQFVIGKSNSEKWQNRIKLGLALPDQLGANLPKNSKSLYSNWNSVAWRVFSPFFKRPDH